MMHHIIRDVELLKQFIDWLPELEVNERYFLCLQARKKYQPSLNSADKTQLKRFVSSKLTLLDKILQLECPVGCFKTRSGEIITDEAMVLYITLNPRDMRKAAFHSISALSDMLYRQDAQSEIDVNPHAEVLSQIHKAKSRTVFVHFDVDITTSDGCPKCELQIPEIYSKTVGIVGKEAVTIIQTRGGCHVLIDPGKVVCETKNWYPIVVRTLNCDQVGDLMVPVVGCCQGGFVPTFYLP